MFLLALCDMNVANAEWISNVEDITTLEGIVAYTTTSRTFSSDNPTNVYQAISNTGTLTSGSLTN